MCQVLIRFKFWLCPFRYFTAVQFNQGVLYKPIFLDFTFSDCWGFVWTVVWLRELAWYAVSLTCSIDLVALRTSLIIWLHITDALMAWVLNLLAFLQGWDAKRSRQHCYTHAFYSLDSNIKLTAWESHWAAVGVRACCLLSWLEWFLNLTIFKEGIRLLTLALADILSPKFFKNVQSM